MDRPTSPSVRSGGSPATPRLPLGVLTWASSALHTSCSLSGVMSTGTSNGEPSSWPPSSWNCTSSRCTSPDAASSCGNKPGGGQSLSASLRPRDPHAERRRPRPVRVHPPPQLPPSCVPTWRRSEAEGWSAAFASRGQPPATVPSGVRRRESGVQVESSGATSASSSTVSLAATLANFSRPRMLKRKEVS